MKRKPATHSTSFRRLLRNHLLNGVLLCALPMLMARAQQPAPALDQAAVDAILGSPAADWKLAPNPTIEKAGERNVLTGGKQNLTITGLKQYPVDVEYDLVLRLNPPVGTPGSNVTFFIGVKPGVPASVNNPSIQLGALPGGTNVQLCVGGKTAKVKAWKTVTNYALKAVTTPSLAWPENLRKRVEADMASLPDVNNKWFHIRLVVRKNLVQFYLDDRLVEVQNEDTLDATGTISLTISPGTEIASLQVKPIQPEDPLFCPIAIGGFLNASLINGQALDHGTLPQPDTLTKVGGVPFLFPKADAKGNDHISLAPSWAEFGTLETYVESQTGEFGGRWPTALTVNPARIQLRIPNDHYNRLYLIAAASDEPNTVPVITAQFYKAKSGFPENFTTKVPLFTAKASSVTKLPAKLKDGKSGSLYLVTIDIDPAKLSKLGNIPSAKADPDADFANGDLAILDVELTKEVTTYQCYPDPNCHSVHQAGLPSSAHIYAVTLERDPISLDFNPDTFAAVWTAPAVPSFTATLGNRTSAPRKVDLTLTTVSHDGSEKTEQKQTVTVPAGSTDTLAKFTIANLKLNGYHDVVLTMKDGSNTWTEKRSLARLPVDTRERGNWQPGRGPAMGFWSWGGGHDTPSQLQELEVMYQAGSETRTNVFSSDSVPVATLQYAKDHNFVNFFKFNQACIYDTAFFDAKLKAAWDTGDRAVASAALLERLKTREITGIIPAGNLVPFFPEPNVGTSTYINHPEFYGEPEYKLTADEEVLFKKLLDLFMVSAKVVRKEWPDAKILLPHGDPLFCIPFLRYSQEVRDLIDGVCLDMPGFDRLPEMQLHQVAHLRLYEMMVEFKKYGKTPELITNEATFVPTYADGLTPDEAGDIHTRNMLIYFVYGVYRQASTTYPFDCADYWGEEQYGAAGMFSRLPHVSPRPAYLAYATLTRHLNRANYVKFLPTGSNTAFALQFKNYKSGNLINVMWTIRGKRTATLTVPAGAKVSVYDENDNLKPLTEKNGTASFTIDQSPCYVEGLASDPTITLGDPDHSDSKPASDALKLSNLGDGNWKLSGDRDMIYENNMPGQIVRFPGKMSVTPTDAPAEQGSKALGIHLEKQDKERQLMPWYTTIVPAKPIVIPGHATHLGLWVKAFSDWGRVVYCLTDAKGQRWLSIGTKESWNCDDTRQWSSFCFDGWRYLRFELPSNAPYDNFRLQGTTWWGHHGPGEGIVHLPLTLDKIIVERRTHTLYLDSVLPAKPDDVLLGDLTAEYAKPSDKTEEAVAQSNITMPAPTGLANLSNPIKDLETTGVGPATQITHIDPPAHEYDGTRGNVFFDTTPNAVTYNIWVSPYEDGHGAVKLGTGWKEPGQLMNGLRPDIEFYAFVDYIDKDGKPSKPSKPFKFTLKDMFPMK
ncbi:MAG: hypothetical protein ABI443_12360 [Chthoniobacterales bacterium]